MVALIQFFTIKNTHTRQLMRLFPFILNNQWKLYHLWDFDVTNVTHIRNSPKAKVWQSEVNYTKCQSIYQSCRWEASVPLVP